MFLNLTNCLSLTFSHWHLVNLGVEIGIRATPGQQPKRGFLSGGLCPGVLSKGLCPRTIEIYLQMTEIM